MERDEKKGSVKVSVSIPAELWEWVESVSMGPGNRSKVVTAALADYQSQLCKQPASALYRVAQAAARYSHERKERGLGKIKKSVE